MFVLKHRDQFGIVTVGRLIPLLLGLFIWCSASSNALAEKRVALVIGNGAYKNAVHLPNPANDAQDVAAALTRTGFETIAGFDLDKAGMDEHAIRFARMARNADVAIFYYSGHAMQFAGVNYLMPIDAKLTDEADLRRMMRVDDIVADLQQAKNLRILVLDACRDNPLAEEMKRSIGLTRAVSMQHGLVKIDSPEGMIVAYATQAGRTAEDGNGRNSPYTGAFLKHIEATEEIGTVFRRIGSDVYDATGHAQLPELSLSLIGEFYLRGKPPVAPVMQSEQSDTCAGADAHWKKAEMIGTKVGFEDHLSRFPNCAFADSARAKLSALIPPAEPAVRTPPANFVDRATSGTWEATVPNNRGVARWIWDILPGGTYRFRSEGPGSVKRHEGTITLSDGRWTLRSTLGLAGWVDGGTYEFRDVNTLVMTGRLGTGIWRRIEAPVGEGVTRRGPVAASRSRR
ncbi:MAG: caspase family protein [Methylocella sp.]